MNQPLTEIFKYNRWANLTLLEACSGLSDEVLASRPPGISGAVRELLTHLVGSQQTFLLRMLGRQHEGEWTRESAWPGFDALIDVAARTSDELIAIASVLDDDTEVDLPYAGKVFRFPKSFFLVHASSHGAELRAEIKIALAQLGRQTPDLDGWQYSVAAGYGQEVDL
ncbi:MAG: DUF664 domain-containing protein [Dehalococcoidia bacterium]|nr:DUF664 domain-containing protein [Dehalococcoidia bacterium]